MNNIGIVRKVDELGRIVLPKELRKTLDINAGDDFQIFLDNENIILKKYNKLRNYKKELINIINSFSNILKYNIYFIINNRDLLNNKRINNEIVNIIQERKIYLNEQIKRVSIFENIIEEGKVIIYPIVIDSDLLGTIIIVGNYKSIDMLNVCKIINNLIKSNILIIEKW